MKSNKARALYPAGSLPNPKRAALLWLTVAVTLAAIILWQLLLNEISYYVTAAAMLLLAMLPLFVRFEKKKTSARELALLATLIALATVSRAVFYLVPQVKPVAAVVIASAVCLGAEKGYIIGAFTAFISNFLFGQGPWTPFQMFALGMVGLLAGWIYSHWEPHKRDGKMTLPQLLALSATGFVLAFAVYGLFVDISTVLMTYGTHITWQGILSVYAAGVPFSLIFGLSTALFLFFFGDAFIRKLNRVLMKTEKN